MTRPDSYLLAELRIVHADRDRLRQTLIEALNIAENPAKPQNALDGVASIIRAALAPSEDTE
jgi:hypothetical protein